MPPRGRRRREPGRASPPGATRPAASLRHGGTRPGRSLAVRARRAPRRAGPAGRPYCTQDPAPRGVDVDAHDQRPRARYRTREHAWIGLQREVVIMATPLRHRVRWYPRRSEARRLLISASVSARRTSAARAKDPSVLGREPVDHALQPAEQERRAVANSAHRQRRVDAVMLHGLREALPRIRVLRARIRGRRPTHGERTPNGQGRPRLLTAWPMAAEGCRSSVCAEIPRV